MRDSFPFFLASGVCAFIVFVAALTAWLEDRSWDKRVPPTVTVLIFWTWVFFAFGILAEALQG